jgi:hypothetical protein
MTQAKDQARSLQASLQMIVMAIDFDAESGSRIKRQQTTTANPSFPGASSSHPSPFSSHTYTCSTISQPSGPSSGPHPRPVRMPKGKL